MSKTASEIPFPGKDEAYGILHRDYVVRKIPKELRESLVDQAWEMGRRGAEEFLAAHRDCAAERFTQVMEADGLRIQRVDQDYVSGRVRYFADILPKTGQVCVYLKSIALWAEERGCSPELAQDLILMHEYFHHWEFGQKTPASRLYTVPMLRLGPVRVGKTGVAALSEIAANAFVWGLWEADFLRVRTQWAEQTAEEACPDAVEGDDPETEYPAAKALTAP